MTGTNEAGQALKHVSEHAEQWLKSLEELKEQIQINRIKASKENIPIQTTKLISSNKSIIDNSFEIPLASASTSVDMPVKLVKLVDPNNQSSNNPRKRKSRSIISHDESMSSKYKTKCMVAVLYDSNIQSGLESLVKNINIARNIMRRARQAKRVPFSYTQYAQQLPSPEPKTHHDSIDWEQIDSRLEQISNSCENAAHKLLRDGDCDADIDCAYGVLQDAKIICEKDLEELKLDTPVEEIFETHKEDCAKNHQVNNMINNIDAKEAMLHLSVLPPTYSLPNTINLEIDDSTEDEEDNAPFQLPPHFLIRTAKPITS